MKLAGRIPVEPLDEERITNIERRVVAGAVDAAVRRPDIGAPRRHAAWAFGAIALAAAGVVGWMLHPAPRAELIAEPAPVRVETTAQRSVLDLGDARIESDPATVFAVTRPGGGVVISLVRGKVELEVARRGGRPPLIVRAGDTDVVVVGTHFTVYYDGDEVDVRVREGIVRVVRQHQEERIAAGQTWRTRKSPLAIADRAASSPAPASPPAEPPPASAAPDSSVPVGDTAIAVGALPDVMRDHQAAVPDAPPVAAAPARVATPPVRTPADGARPRAPARAGDPIVALRTAIRAQPIEPALNLGQHDPASAIAGYYDIAAHRAGDEASRAFYSIAALTYLKLSQSASALDVLDAYMRRFPGGKEYRAVLWLRIRILCLDKIDDRCRAAAYTYLHEAPDGPAAPIAERLTLTE